MTTRTLVAAALSSMLLGLALGQLLPSAQASGETSDDANYRQLAVFAEALHTIRTQHIEPPETSALIQSAIKGMARSLDEHSAYLDANLLQLLREDNAGEYLGIGIELLPTPDGPRILRVFPDSPAARRGIRAGDILLAINGRLLERESIEHIVLEMRRSSDVQLSLTISREGRVMDVELEKGVVHVEAVSSETLPNGQLWIKLRQFNEHSARTVRQTLQNERAAARAGVILDVRDNPGGLLSEAIDVAQLFLDEGVIVQVRDGQQRQARSWIANSKQTVFRGPLVVLMNENSASGSEIVAAALRDNGRAQLVGHQSFGKGTVQSIITLLDSSALKLTVTEYFGPAGYCIHHVGVAPDFEPPAAPEGTREPAAERDHADADSTQIACRSELDTRRTILRQASVQSARALAAYNDPALALASELIQEQLDPAPQPTGGSSKR